MPSRGWPRRGHDVDFTVLAPRYDDLRPADENWWGIFEAIAVELGPLESRRARILDVGCGTGRLARGLAERGARVWGVDPADAMLDRARAVRARNVVFARAAAEALPFPDGSFDRAVLRQVVHLVDRLRAFAEVARVLAARGRVVVATFHPDHFENVWVARVFPRVAELDRARFPTPEELVAELGAAGFAKPTIRRLQQAARLTREDALERLRGRYISTLQLLDDSEYRAGLARAQRELPAQVAHELDWVVVAAERTP